MAVSFRFVRHFIIYNMLDQSRFHIYLMRILFSVKRTISTNANDVERSSVRDKERPETKNRREKKKEYSAATEICKGNRSDAIKLFIGSQCLAKTPTHFTATLTIGNKKNEKCSHTQHNAELRVQHSTSNLIRLSKSLFEINSG